MSKANLLISINADQSFNRRNNTRNQNHDQNIQKQQTLIDKHRRGLRSRGGRRLILRRQKRQDRGEEGDEVEEEYEEEEREPMEMQQLRITKRNDRAIINHGDQQTPFNDETNPSFFYYFGEDEEDEKLKEGVEEARLCPTLSSRPEFIGPKQCSRIRELTSQPPTSLSFRCEDPQRESPNKRIGGYCFETLLYSDLSPVSRHYRDDECFMCRQPAWAPVILECKCKNFFCHDCAINYAKINSGICPTCKLQFAVHDSGYAKGIVKTLDMRFCTDKYTHVYCAVEGCRWDGYFRQLKYHMLENTVEHASSRCSGCHMFVGRDLQDTHQKYACKDSFRLKFIEKEYDRLTRVVFCGDQSIQLSSITPTRKEDVEKGIEEIGGGEEEEEEEVIWPHWRCCAGCNKVLEMGKVFDHYDKCEPFRTNYEHFLLSYANKSIRDIAYHAWAWKKCIEIPIVAWSYYKWDVSVTIEVIKELQYRGTNDKGHKISGPRTLIMNAFAGNKYLKRMIVLEAHPGVKDANSVILSTMGYYLHVCVFIPSKKELATCVCAILRPPREEFGMYGSEQDLLDSSKYHRRMFRESKILYFGYSPEVLIHSLAGLCCKGSDLNEATVPSGERISLLFFHSSTAFIKHCPLEGEERTQFLQKSVYRNYRATARSSTFSS